MNAEEQAVAGVLKRYEDALNRSDTDAAMELYASDGVFMPQHSPSSVGAAAVRKAYGAVLTPLHFKSNLTSRKSNSCRPIGRSRGQIRPAR
jgi:uncharacterized protein (TIGR02246 family)